MDYNVYYFLHMDLTCEIDWTVLQSTGVFSGASLYYISLCCVLHLLLPIIPDLKCYWIKTSKHHSL